MARIDFVTGAPQRYMPLVDRLSVLPDRLGRVLAGRSRGDLQREPAEGEWSAARVAAHMVSYARHNHGFIFNMSWMTEPTRQPWDEEAEVGSEGWERLDGPGLVEAFEAELRKTIDVLVETPDASWGRSGTIPNRGRRSLRQQV